MVETPPTKLFSLESFNFTSQGNHIKGNTPATYAEGTFLTTPVSLIIQL